ncbi:MAG: hypothetical protein JNK48_28100 [Bryobacterales bacterium]|nr:hypothetical protein [Bryobacterales bacterium]
MRPSEILFRILPPLIALAIHFPGLHAWFQQDDFAWMGLLREFREGAPLLDILFKPSQHGTWRPLSERAYFLIFPAIFGYEALPMRLAAFLTQAVSLALAQDIALRLTRSRLAAAFTPFLWMASSHMTIAMISNGAYVHVLGAFFLLAATRCLIAGRTRAMWTAFSLGFLASESNVVFPAIATLYTRRLNLPLWAASILYFAAHMLLAPKRAAGAYAMHFDLSIFSTLYRYWRMIFEPENFTVFTGLPVLALQLTGIAITLLIPALSIVKKQNTGILFAAMFVVLLAPVLPLAGHVTGYYLTVPLAAFALAAAWLVSAWRPAAIPVLAFILLSAPCAYKATEWWRARGAVAQTLARRIFATRQANPGKTILLHNVSDEQFWTTLAHYPFVEYKKTYVYLAPGEGTRIQPHPESAVRLSEFFLSPAQLSLLRQQDRILDLQAP